MENSCWIELLLYLVALALITKPLGLYLERVLDTNGRTWLDPVLKPVERLTYRMLGVAPSGSRIGNNTQWRCCCSAW